MLVQIGPGTLFAQDFRIRRLIAEGGMGAVYVAEQLSTGRDRALKVMVPQLVADARSRDRFALEARIGGRIQSDHVVEVLGSGIDEATQLPWLAMELLEGNDLATVIERRGALPADEVREIAEQLCDALGKAHTAGIVHRDLKPENVFVATPRRRGVPFTIKVMDFGIATLVQENRTAATVTTAIGSPLWMAPEQAQQGAKIRPSTDVWALGLIIYHLLTGRMYWRCASSTVAPFNLSALIVEVMTHPIDQASARAEEFGHGQRLPSGFDGWFSRCVVRDPASRFPDATAAMGALREILGTAPTSFPATQPLLPKTLVAMPPTPESPITNEVIAADQNRSGVRRAPVLALAAGIGGAAALALLITMLTGSSTSPDAADAGGGAASSRPVQGPASPSPVNLPAPAHGATTSVPAIPREALPAAPSTAVSPRGARAGDVREVANVRLRDGVVETWRLVWVTEPTLFCHTQDVLADIAAWACGPFMLSEQGEAEIVRERAGAVVDRFSLSVAFGGDGETGIPTLPRWNLSDADREAARNTPAGGDPSARFATRPPARIMRLGDYDGDGTAAEFALPVSTSSSGHVYTVLVGLFDGERLSLAAPRGWRRERFTLAQPHRWELIRGGRSARVVQWECGNHGADREEFMDLSWSNGELLAAERSRPCRDVQHVGQF
jgi:serine/threonine protein kinase